MASADDSIWLDTWLTEGAGEAPEPAIATPRDLEGRYAWLSRIGSGGMGEVWSVRDRKLGRTVAAKVAFRDLWSQPVIAARFHREIAITAHLDHPGVLGVYDAGRLVDGRTYFTMPQVAGESFAALIRRHHAGDEAWKLERLMRAFVSLVQTVSYVHDRGVVHRDLKPSNVLVGAFGEVYLLDWGIACWSDRAEVPVSALVEADEEQTQGIRGTPAYMAPEQLEGERGRPEADVWGLGGILSVLLGGRPPWAGLTPAESLQMLPERQPLTLPESAPTALVELVASTLSVDPMKRPSAVELADGLEGWLDRRARTQRATALVTEAAQHFRTSHRARVEAERLRERARALQDATRPSAPVEDKRAQWDLDDEADRIMHEAQKSVALAEGALNAALQHDPQHEGAHTSFVEHYRRQHAEAPQGLRAHFLREATRHAAWIRPGDNLRRWLEGSSTIQLHSDPPAEVRLLQVVSGRRSRCEPYAEGLTTPLEDLELPAGSWIAELTAEGCEPQRVPLFTERGGRWSAVRPGADKAHSIRIPRRGELAEGERWIPAGWAWLGDASAHNGLARRRVWVDGFVMRTHPLTVREMLAFLDHVDAQGTDASAWAPEDAFARTDSGWRPVADAQGDVWDLDWPALLTSWTMAQAWCAWLAEVEGLPWRLPWELEHEKAMRGVDGRPYPWGQHPEPTWSSNALGVVGKPSPASVYAHPVDESVYGVRGLAGNARDWCADVFRASGPVVGPDGLWERPGAPESGDERTWRSQRGGVWSASITFGRAGHRHRAPASQTHAVFGVRPVRSWLA